MAVHTLLTTSSSSFSSSSPSSSSPSSDAAACDGPAAAVASAAASSLRAVPLRLRLNPSLIDRIKSTWPRPQPTSRLPRREEGIRGGCE